MPIEKKMENAVISPFIRTSFIDLKATIKSWWGFFLVLLILNAGATYLEMATVDLGPSTVYYQLVLVLFFVVMSAFASIRFMERFEEVPFTKEQYLYGAFTYVLYSLAYFALVILGLILFIIPFFFFGTFFILAPLIALRENNVNAFKRSFYYVKKRPSLAFLLFICLIIPEFLSFIASFFSSGSIAFYTANIILTITETFLALFVLKLIVDYYHALKLSMVDVET